MCRSVKLLAAALTPILLFSPLTGCGGQTPPAQSSAPAPQTSGAPSGGESSAASGGESSAVSGGETSAAADSGQESGATGAATAPAAPDDGRTWAAGKPVASARIVDYYSLVETYAGNTDDREFTQDGCAYTISVPPFDFLKDEALNKKIADRIASETEALALSGVPRMTGADRYAGRSPTICSAYVNYPSGGAVNNVLSVDIGRWVSYGKDDGGDYYEPRYLNLDMNTGDDIPLSAVFTDGYDYVSAINGYLREYIASCELASDSSEAYPASGFFYQIAPFVGIRENQPYYVTDTGLSVVLDFDNSEFEIPNGPTAEVFIPYSEFGGHIAIFERYQSSESLYRSDPMLVLAVRYPENRQAPLKAGSADTYSYSGAQLSPDILPADAYAALSGELAGCYPSLSEFQAMAEDEPAREDGVIPTCWSEAGLEVYRDFYTLNCYTSVSGFTLRDDVYRTDLFCYNEAEGRMAEPSDFFLPGVDYRAILKPLLERYAAEYDSISVEISDELDFRSGGLTGRATFSPAPRGLAVFVSWYKKDGSRSAEPGTSQLYIDYADIGYGNLTLF